MSDEPSITADNDLAISEDRDYLDTVADTDVAVKYLERIQPHLDKSHVMANRTEDEVQEIKWKVRMMTDEFLFERPPKDSKMVGDLRKQVMGDGKQPLTDQEIQDIRRIEDVIISRITLGRRAKLHELISKIIQVKESKKEKDEEKSSSKSDIRSLFSI